MIAFRMQYLSIFSTLLLASMATPTRAGSIGTGSPGVIPLKPHTVNASSDLILKGKLLTPDEADELSLKNDISLPPEKTRLSR